MCSKGHAAHSNSWHHLAAATWHCHHSNITDWLLHLFSQHWSDVTTETQPPAPQIKFLIFFDAASKAISAALQGWQCLLDTWRQNAATKEQPLLPVDFFLFLLTKCCHSQIPWHKAQISHSTKKNTMALRKMLWLKEKCHGMM